jgi:hypothetical protein
MKKSIENNSCSTPWFVSNKLTLKHQTKTITMEFKKIVDTIVAKTKANALVRVPQINIKTSNKNNNNGI